MIEKDTYCDDVLNQIAAAQSALNSVGKLLLAGHLKSCVVEWIRDGELEVIDELIKTMNTLMTGKVDPASDSIQVQYDEAIVNLETIKQTIEEQVMKWYDSYEKSLSSGVLATIIFFLKIYPL